MAAVVLGLSVVVAIQSAPAKAATASLKWSVTTGKIGESSPLIVNLDGQNDVVIGSTDNKVYALHGSNGSAVGGWPKPTTSPIGSSPAAADTNGDGKPEVFIGAGTDYKQNGGLYRFDAGGGHRHRLPPTD